MTVQLSAMNSSWQGVVSDGETSHYTEAIRQYPKRQSLGTAYIKPNESIGNEPHNTERLEHLLDVIDHGPLYDEHGRWKSVNK